MRKLSKTGVTYSCPYFWRINTGDAPDVVAYLKDGQKWYYMDCVCGRIHLPAELFVKFRMEFCANEDVTAWKECTLAKAMTEYLEGKKK